MRRHSTSRGPSGGPRPALLGDGLVPVESALGRHADPGRALTFPEDHQWVGDNVGHLDLLSRPKVYEVVRSWLSG